MPGTDSFSPSVWLKTPTIEPAASHSGQYGGGGGSLVRRVALGAAAVGPVVVPRREVLDLDAPQRLAGVVLLRELLALGVVDAGVVGRAVAVGVDVRAAAALGHDLDHEAVLGRHPRALALVVVGGGDDRAGLEAEEVVDVGRDRLGELDVGRARLDGVVDAELDGVRVGRGVRQLARHLLLAVRARRCTRWRGPRGRRAAWSGRSGAPSWRPCPARTSAWPGGRRRRRWGRLGRRHLQRVRVLLDRA